MRVGNVSSTSGASSSVRPIWADVSSEDGERLFLTVWRGDNRLNLYTFDVDSLGTKLASADLGPCTIAELNAATYVAYPYTPTFDDAYVYIFGRMSVPAGLTGIQHLLVSLDGGATFTSLESGFGADYIGAFRAEGDVNGNRQFFGVRNGSGVAKLYEGTEALVYRSDLPFAAGVAVYVDAMSIGPQRQVAAGARAAGAIMLAECPSPYTTWEDLTLNYPITGEISSVVYV